MTRSQAFITLALVLSLPGLAGCGPAPTPVAGTPAAWATQLAVAEQAAWKADPHALLMQVDASTIPGIKHTPSGNYDTLQVEFRFFKFAGPLVTVGPRTAGGEVRAIFNETAPTATLQLNPYFDYKRTLPTAAQQQQIMQTLATVQISAADAYTRTLADGQAHAQRYQASVYPTLRLDLDEQRAQAIGRPAGVPAAWLVTYLAVGADDLPVPGATTLFLWVDARTGAILLRGER
jgi:hypothetical protein